MNRPIPPPPPARKVTTKRTYSMARPPALTARHRPILEDAELTALEDFPEDRPKNTFGSNFNATVKPYNAHGIASERGSLRKAAYENRSANTVGLTVKDLPYRMSSDADPKRDRAITEANNPNREV